jgi:hypothetical protein
MVDAERGAGKLTTFETAEELLLGLAEPGARSVSGKNAKSRRKKSSGPRGK